MLTLNTPSTRVAAHVAAHRRPVPAPDLLTERQDYYDSCCQLLAGCPTLTRQNMVVRALIWLNDARFAAGLPAVVGPKLLSLDELLAAGTH